MSSCGSRIWSARTPSCGWLLGQLGYVRYPRWEAVRSRRLGATYIVVERSPDLLGGRTNAAGRG